MTLFELRAPERSRLLARHGLWRVLDDLHPKIRWTKRGLSLADRDCRAVTVGERGLLLMPSAYLWPHVAAIVEEPWLPTIVYPATGIAGLWQAPAAQPGALGRLLGRTRALVLTTLDQPLSTTTLAAMTGLSTAIPATVRSWPTQVVPCSSRDEPSGGLVTQALVRPGHQGRFHGRTRPGPFGIILLSRFLGPPVPGT